MTVENSFCKHGHIKYFSKGLLFSDQFLLTDHDLKIRQKGNMIRCDKKNLKQQTTEIDFLSTLKL